MRGAALIPSEYNKGLPRYLSGESLIDWRCISRKSNREEKEPGCRAWGISISAVHIFIQRPVPGKSGQMVLKSPVYTAYQELLEPASGPAEEGGQGGEGAPEDAVHAALHQTAHAYCSFLTANFDFASPVAACPYFDTLRGWKENQESYDTVERAGFDDYASQPLEREAEAGKRLFSTGPRQDLPPCKAFGLPPSSAGCSARNAPGTPPSEA